MYDGEETTLNSISDIGPMILKKYNELKYYS